jgi:hypothetical protein
MKSLRECLLWHSSLWSIEIIGLSGNLSRILFWLLYMDWSLFSSFYFIKSSKKISELAPEMVSFICSNLGLFPSYFYSYQSGLLLEIYTDRNSNYGLYNCRFLSFFNISVISDCGSFFMVFEWLLTTKELVPRTLGLSI